MDTMLVDGSRHKRRRSPSPINYDHPDPALDSPLDVLIKRRRRRQPGVEEAGDYFNHNQNYDIHQNHQNHQHHEHDNQAGPAVPYVERRRAKQWDKLNAPRPSLPNQPQSQPHLEFTPPHPTAFSRSHSHPVDHLVNSSPPHAYSQPLPQHPMSSSPIRHQPFGSSPFRSQASNQVTSTMDLGSSESATRVENLSVYEVEDDMDPEEMRKSWGEQYAEQNEILHSVVSLPSWHVQVSIKSLIQCSIVNGSCNNAVLRVPTTRF